MFHVITVIDIPEHVKHLDVHNGKIPSVELKCFGKEGEEDDEETYLHTVNLMFSGDMERQRFMNEVKEGSKFKDEPEGDRDKKGASVGDDDDDQDDDGNADEFTSEEEKEPVLYD